MKNTPKLFRVFLDTSVLLSGLNSPFGASAFIISLFKLKKVIIVISPEVILEAKLAVEKKFPKLSAILQDFLLSEPEIIEKLTPKEIQDAYKLIKSEDTPILTAAVKSKPDYLITLDKRFQKLAQSKVNFKILTPGDFVKIYRQKNETRSSPEEEIKKQLKELNNL